MSALYQRRRRKPEINIVPLIDVLTTLIFFFLITMQFRATQVLNIVVPQIETAGQNKMVEQLEIGVGAEEGEYYFNGARVTEEQLAAAITAAARVNRGTPVLLIADEKSYLKSVTFVMDNCRKQGLDTIRLQSR